MPNEGWREPTFSFSTLHFLNSARLMCNSDRVVFIQVKNRMLSAQHYQSTLVHSKSCFFFVRDTRCVWWMWYTVCVCVCVRALLCFGACAVLCCACQCVHTSSTRRVVAPYNSTHSATAFNRIEPTEKSVLKQSSQRTVRWNFFFVRLCCSSYARSIAHTRFVHFENKNRESHHIEWCLC